MITARRPYLSWLLGVFLGSNLLCFLTSFSHGASNEARMVAHFVSVGQADSTLLEFPCGAVLIDAGSQDDESTEHLIDYLTKFFDRRHDLSNTLATIFITHPHIDHTKALRRVVETFHVRSFVDNGQTEGSGIANIKFVRKLAHDKHEIELREAAHSEIMAGGKKNGITDDTIDALKCERCDPAITIFSGAWDNDPEWSVSEMNNKNNHSLVIRVDFGKTSMLFSGDLEEQGIKSLLEYYGTKARQAFDVDLYHVGHHGSRNATTAAFLDLMTPEVAVVSMGHWDSGKEPPEKFSTFSYGHPNRGIISLISTHMEPQFNRPTAVNVLLGNGAKSFTLGKVTRRIYATDWDGDITVQASLEKIERVTGHH